MVEATVISSPYDNFIIHLAEHVEIKHFYCRTLSDGENGGALWRWGLP